MPQDVSKNRIALKPLQDKTSGQPWSMDANADRLMDDVFGDVERMLETGSEPAVEPAEPEYVSLKQMKIPQVTMPSGMVSRPVAQSDASSVEKARKPQQSGMPLEKLLLVAACTSLAITLLLWLAAGQGRLNWLFGNNSTSEPEAQKASQAEVGFADYIQRSLEVIDQKTDDRKQNPVVPPPPAATKPPLPVLVPGNLPQNTNRPSVLERVYIPVYPQPRIIYTNPAPPAPTAKPSPQAAATPTYGPAASVTPRVTPTYGPVATRTPRVTPTYGPVAPVTRITPTYGPVAPVTRITPSQRPVASASPKPTPSPRPVASASPKATQKATPKATPTPTSSLRPVASAPAFPNLSAALPSEAPPQPSPKPTASPTASPQASPKPTAASPTATPSPKPVAASPSPSPTRTQASPKPVASPTAAADSPRSVAVVPSAVTEPAPRRQRSTQAYSSESGTKYTLQGVLVLGDKSAAIFEVNGVSRRIYVGESIGSSGWTLVEINNDNSEAVVRRNGEVRSVFVGQQF